MTGNEALALLAWGLPQDQVRDNKNALEMLAARLGEWPLLLKLVNGFLRDRTLKNRQTLDQAISGVHRRVDAKGLITFDSINADDRATTVAKTIGVSLELLPYNESARFAELAVFPEDADVPVGVTASLWAKTAGLNDVDTEDLLSRFESLSLLLFLDLDRRSFRLHDTIRSFLLDHVGKVPLAALHKTLLEAMPEIETAGDEASRRYCNVYRQMHLVEAERPIPPNDS